MDCPRTDCGAPQAKKPRLQQWIARRAWVQTAFLALWLAPAGGALHGLPGCVFHCYSCPLSSLACPIGLMANYAALLPAAPVFPFLLAGVLFVVGGLGGTLVCGWSCPLGFFQDLLARVPLPKWQLPGWTSWGRYAVLGGLVLFLPWFLGTRGIPFDEQAVSICRLCPAGALEAGLPRSIASVAAGNAWLMSGLKTAILIVFLGSALLIHRPWCRVLCPLGGLLALFNRKSLFHLQFNGKACVECNLCRSRCSMGVELDRDANATGCVRCLECASCGALEPSLALPGAAPTPPPKDASSST